MLLIEDKLQVTVTINYIESSLLLIVEDKLQVTLPLTIKKIRWNDIIVNGYLMVTLPINQIIESWRLFNGVTNKYDFY